MKRNFNFYKDVEQLNYYIYYDGKFIVPDGWQYIEEKNDKKTGMYAAAYKSPDGEIVMFVRGTEIKSFKDWFADVQLYKSKMPSQADSAFKFYKELAEKYGKIIVSGYSLGASIGCIIGNETGAETITFAPYGIGDIVDAKNTDNIINFGNEADPVFQANIDNQLGRIYIVPNTEGYDVNKKYGVEGSDKHSSIGKHLPGHMGDITKAFEYTGRPYKLYASYDYYDDSIFDISNRVFYENSGMPMKDRTPAELEQIIKQYFDNDEKFPSKSDLDRRVRFGELIYVENYMRSDGTKVSGYYRRYPQK